jgi:hypothetical protein
MFILQDHGYTHESPQIKWLIEMLCAYPKEKVFDWIVWQFNWLI